MPNSSARPCRYGRCPHITTHRSGYCEQHRALAYQDNRPSAAERGYDATWRKLRASHLALNPYCVMCAAMGKVERATEVDHIIPHKGDDALRLDPENLASLCSWHHKSKTMRERQ
ncbi:MAG: HNH endonuclease [Parcubacteria group bacterium]